MQRAELVKDLKQTETMRRLRTAMNCFRFGKYAFWVSSSRWIFVDLTTFSNMIGLDLGPNLSLAGPYYICDEQARA